jgi:SAM-dependent methyltransferase
VDEMNSPPFRSFMEGMNAFAAAHGLRQFTNWTKIWEYPWLWQHCLSRVPLRGARVVDLGSEISPMPWYLATRGASVRLVEVNAEAVPLWAALRAKLGVDVEWHVVKSESIPLPDGWADGVTSFSVIEHQADKRKAVGEVARVLRPGGWFAVSFDVCEPAMGMTFPEWNGRALTVREFEDELWRHPAFANGGGPQWNWDAVRPFLAWHRTTAPHHNYVAAAAVLHRKPGASW